MERHSFCIVLGKSPETMRKLCLSLKFPHHDITVFYAVCDICHLDKAFKYEPYVCNSCHDLMEKAMNFNDVAIVSIKENDYIIYFRYMSKNDAINIMKNSNFQRI